MPKNNIIIRANALYIIIFFLIMNYYTEDIYLLPIEISKYIKLMKHKFNLSLSELSKPIEISKYIKLMKHKFNLSLSELSKVRGSSHSPCHG